MERLISDNTVASYAHPRLLLRHRRQLSAGPGTRILYHTQLHEIHTYTYFRGAGLSVANTMAVDGVHGHVVGALDPGDICLGQQVDEEHFFATLRFVPMPFLFFPDARLSDVAGFCRGAFSFVSAGRKGVLMDTEFAAGVGVDFLCAEHLAREDIDVCLVGFMYDESL